MEAGCPDSHPKSTRPPWLAARERRSLAVKPLATILEQGRKSAAGAVGTASLCDSGRWLDNVHNARIAMDDNAKTKTLLSRRKLTRTIGQVLTDRMQSYVATLTPLFRQRAVFGQHIEGSGSEPVKGADQALKEFQALYAKVATAAPFGLSPELKSPLPQMTSSLELSPWEYAHVAKTGGESKTVTVTSPFKAILTYAGYVPRRLGDLLTERNRNNGELQIFVLHYLAMHVVVSRQPGLKQLLDALHFPLASGHLDAFGALPITFIGSAISSSLPADELVIESTELSGNDAFEEIVNIDDIANLRDPLKEQLLKLAKGAS
jgi:hypothetical protein